MPTIEAVRFRTPSVAVVGIVGLLTVSTALVGAESTAFGSSDASASLAVRARAAVASGRGSVMDLAAGRWSRLASPPEGEGYWRLALWTGRDVIAWGRTRIAAGTTPNSTSGTSKHGAAFDPASGRWRRLPPAPIAFFVESTIWTGHAALAWGWAPERSGRPGRNVLLAFDPTRWRWERRARPTMAPRTDAAVAWTGSELVVFGGQSTSGKTLVDGASYDLATNRWGPLPTPPRFEAPSGSTASPVETVGVWVGQSFYVWISHQVFEARARSNTIGSTVQALRWRPGAHHWQQGPVPPKGVPLYDATVMPAETGFAILDGSACLPMMSCVARLTGKSVFFHPSTHSWSPVPSSAVSENAGSFVWTGRSLVAVSPIVDEGGYVLGGYAAALDSAKDLWGRLPQLPVPKAPPSGPVVSGSLWVGSRLIDSTLVLAPGKGPAHGFIRTTLSTATLARCPPISFPDSVGTFCGPPPGPGSGNGPAGSCLGTETDPPCGPGMVAGRYYSYTLISTCANAYVDGRWWRNELPGGSGPTEVWMAVAPGESGAGWISPSGAVGFRPTSSTGCSSTR